MSLYNGLKNNRFLPGLSCSMIFSLLAGLAFQGTGYYVALLWFSAALAFFLVRCGFSVISFWTLLPCRHSLENNQDTRIFIYFFYEDSVKTACTFLHHTHRHAQNVHDDLCCPVFNLFKFGPFQCFGH